jgi:hypothetical protein
MMNEQVGDMPHEGGGVASPPLIPCKLRSIKGKEQGRLHIAAYTFVFFIFSIRCVFQCAYETSPVATVSTVPKTISNKWHQSRS